MSFKLTLDDEYFTRILTCFWGVETTERETEQNAKRETDAMGDSFNHTRIFNFYDI